MCGIVGIVGEESVFSTTAAALGRLEYRGYDSYGFAYRTLDGISIEKAVGAISDAINSDKIADRVANQVLSHTRWATHGGVTQPNAHPHASYDGRIVIVHNGVIENHRSLRRKLQADGIRCVSETDSEVIAHLVAQKLQDGSDILVAIADTLEELIGEYALGILDTSEAGAIFGARYKGPLLAGTNGTEGILASDPIAVDQCDEIIHFEDGDIVRVTSDSVVVFQRSSDGALRQITRPAVSHAFVGTSDSKGDFAHYMLKEMHDSPQALRTILNLTPTQFQKVFPAERRQAAIVGAGSAFYVAMIGQYLLAELAREAVAALPSDEAANLLCLETGDRLIAVSQSGETFDTLEAARTASAMGCEIVSISNVPGNSLERLAHRRIQQGSGVEVCVLSTKSVLSQVAVFLRLALERGRENNEISPVRFETLSKSLLQLPARVEDLINNQSAQIADLAKQICDVTDWFFIGKGVLYPVAMESALKFKEVSYHHAEGMAAGFLKHGTISLIRPEFYTVALLPSLHSDASSYNATLSAVSEIAARGGPVIGIGPTSAGEDDRAQFRHYIGLDYLNDGITDVFLQLVAGQLLAYHCAVCLGRNIDRPRGLAKSVTVR